MRPNYLLLPDGLRGGLERYIEDGCPTGGFLRAVLANDLKESFAKADLENRHRLFDIVAWLYNNAPLGCWGSPKNVDAWIEQGGMKGTK